ncbi:MAG: 50S ribosomal protein L16 [Patescibacteria group bacterium]
MLQPKKTKYRKQFRGKMRGKSVAGSRLDFGDFGLKSLSCGWLKANQIEAARRAIAQHTKRKARVWIRIFPDKPVTSKGSGSPMGAGKGDIDFWAAVIKPGRMLFEIAGVPEELAKEALVRAASKLPFTTKIICRQTHEN